MPSSNATVSSGAAQAANHDFDSELAIGVAQGNLHSPGAVAGAVGNCARHNSPGSHLG